MRKVNGRYRCAYCGAILDIPLSRIDPQVTIRASFARANARTLLFEGEEIHSCELSGRGKRVARSRWSVGQH